VSLEAPHIVCEPCLREGRTRRALHTTVRSGKLRVSVYLCATHRILSDDAQDCPASWFSADSVAGGTVTECHDCLRPYGAEQGFPDLVVPHDVWAQLSPEGGSSGMLCPSCMCKRASQLGIQCEAKFTSGPFAGASQKGGDAK